MNLRNVILVGDVREKLRELPDESVLDPFFGSGTTGLVAALAGRDYIGVELNPAYVEMAERRLAAVKDRLL